MVKGTRAKNDKELYQLMGYALSKWQHVELALFLNFWRFMQLSDYRIASAAFHGIQAFSGKLAMTEFAGLVALRDHKEALSKWKKLVQKCRKKNEKRNHLVHFAARRETFIAPSTINIAAYLRWGANMPSYNKKQLLDMADSFSTLSENLFRFSKDMPLPKPVLPESDQLKFPHWGTRRKKGRSRHKPA